MVKSKKKINVKNILLSILAIIFVVCIFIYEPKEKSGPIPKSKLSEKEKLELEIDDLKSKNDEVQRRISELEYELEEEKNKYESDEEYIDELEDKLHELGYEFETYEMQVK